MQVSIRMRRQTDPIRFNVFKGPRDCLVAHADGIPLVDEHIVNGLKCRPILKRHPGHLLFSTQATAHTVDPYQVEANP